MNSPEHDIEKKLALEIETKTLAVEKLATAKAARADELRICSEPKTAAAVRVANSTAPKACSDFREARNALEIA